MLEQAEAGPTTLVRSVDIDGEEPVERSGIGRGTGTVTVVIEEQESYASLSVDLARGNRRLPAPALEEAADILASYCRGAEEDPVHTRTPVEYFYGPGFLSIAPLRVPVAEDAARELVRFVRAHSEETPTEPSEETPTEPSADGSGEGYGALDLR